MAPAPPSQPGPDFAAHATSVLDFLVKLGAGLGAVWIGVTRIAKPYTAWRRAHYAELTKDVLGTELTQLKALQTNDGQVRDLCERILVGQERILGRQDQMFREMDLFHRIANINHDRLDELNGLLDELGFSSERRIASASEHRRDVDVLLARLKRKKTARDRDEPMTDTGEHPTHPVRNPHAPHPLGDTDS